jgi:hypothetical protein
MRRTDVKGMCEGADRREADQVEAQGKWTQAVRDEERARGGYTRLDSSIRI